MTTTKLGHERIARKWLPACLCVVALIALASVAFTVGSPRAAEVPVATRASNVQITQSSAAAFTNSLYVWYLTNLDRNYKFPSSPEFRPALSQWLTTKFAAHYSAIVNDTDADPLLLSQDTDDSWASTVRSTVIAESSSTATVSVEFGPPLPWKVICHLLKINGQWRLDSVSPPTNSN